MIQWYLYSVDSYNGFYVDYNLGTISHYELRTIIEFIAVFLAHTRPHIHDIMLCVSVLVEH
jgi:hypothetical protein